MEKAKKHLIPNAGERKWVIIANIAAFIILVAGIWYMSHLSLNDYHSRSFKHIFKEYGSIARIMLFFVLAYYVILFIVQKKILERFHFVNNDIVKSWIMTLLRYARKWHAVAAILAIGIISIHIIGAFLYGIELDFQNVSGLLSLAVLLPVPISGLLRYRKLDQKWHLRFGLLFALLFIVHSL